MFRGRMIAMAVLLGGSPALSLAIPATAGAHPPRPGKVVCNLYTENFGPVGAYQFSLSGCSDPSNTGGSGQGTVTPPHGSFSNESVVVTWATGGTSTLSLTPGATTRGNCGMDMGGLKNPPPKMLTVQVTADTTGSIPLRTFTDRTCFSSDDGWNVRSNFRPFKL
jgi:hypothetical protein